MQEYMSYLKRFSSKLEDLIPSSPVVNMSVIPCIFIVVVCVLTTEMEDSFKIGVLLVSLSIGGAIILVAIKVGSFLLIKTRNVRSYFQHRIVKRAPASFLLSVIHLLPEKCRKCLEQEIFRYASGIL